MPKREQLLILSCENYITRARRTQFSALSDDVPKLTFASEGRIAQIF